MPETNEHSGEADYKAHRLQERIGNARIYLLAAIILLLAGYAAYASRLFGHAGLSLASVINMLGIWISGLLILKQMHVQSNYADRICSLFLHRNECNDVLESDAAKLFGVFSWSEIGMAYFISNVLMILLLPSLYPYAAWINVCTLPYTVWSVWYQKAVVKQWCPLCLIVQGLLWLLFIVNLTFGMMGQPAFRMDAIIPVLCIYAVPFLGISILVPHITNSIRKVHITQEMNSLKADEEIFTALLRAKPKHTVDSYTSPVLWGNPDAPNRITVITNPHCNPCAKMHKRLEQLLKNTNNGYCVQYILASFNEELEDSSRFFIAMYQQMSRSDYMAFLNGWYVEGKKNRKEYYRKYRYNPEQDTGLLLRQQKEWLSKTNIKATPTVLFNGYELPEKYKVEDLIYFTQTDIT